MSRIEVQPGALVELGKQLGEQARTSGDAAASTARELRGVSTGAGALDAAVDEFVNRWHGQVTELTRAAQSLGQAVTSAASNYRRTDASAMPASGTVLPR